MRRQLFICALFLATLFSAVPAKATSLTFESRAVEGMPGTFEFLVNVVDATDLYGFEFDVSFDPAAFQFEEAQEGGFLGLGGSTFFFALPPDGGLLTTASTLFGTAVGVSGSGLLARLLFTGLEGASADLLLTRASLLNSDQIEIPADITPVPEPSTLGLMGIGLAALARRLRRKTPVSS